MASSLKGYIPGLARLMRTSPAALYERQRALVRAGLLAPEEGRGPGSGVRTTAQAVALLLLSVLSTDRLSESEARTRTVAALHPTVGERCPFTRRRSFAEALSFVLAATGIAAGALEISVSRTADRAWFRYYGDDGLPKLSEFAGANAAEPGISVTASLSQGLLLQIVADVQSMLSQTFDMEEPQ